MPVGGGVGIVSGPFSGGAGPGAAPLAGAGARRAAWVVGLLNSPLPPHPPRTPLAMTATNGAQFGLGITSSS